MPRDGGRGKRGSGTGRLQKKPLTRSKRSATTAASRVGAAGNVLVKVRTPGYEPPGIEIRARVTPTLLTARVTRARMRALESDPEVVSIASPSKLGPA